MELGRKNKDIVVFDADVASSTRSILFGQAFPDRFFNVGIAEANMAAMAAGIVTAAKIPFINTFACFMLHRCADPIRSLMAYGNLNVKIAGTYSGLSDSYDGAIHHSIMDIAFMRSLPNMTVISPCDSAEAVAATEAAIHHRGPVYLRLHRNEVAEVPANARDPFRIGKGTILRDGKDLTILATGYLVQKSLTAAEFLAVGLPTPMAFVGMQDTFAESGEYEKLLKKYGLGAGAIVEKARSLM